MPGVTTRPTTWRRPSALLVSYALVVLAAALGLSGGLGPAGALVASPAVADRSPQAFEVSGTPVEGGERSDLATDLDAGTWRDTVGRTSTGELWYRYRRTLPGSTVHVGVSAAPEETSAALQLDVTTQGGDSCGSDSQSGGGSGTLPITAAASVGYDEADEPDEDCQSDELLIKVSSGYGSGEDLDVGLVVWEEPRITNQADLEPGDEGTAFWREPDASGSNGEVRGGTSFEDAVELEPGSYSGTVVVGDVQVFRVPLDWGDQLSAQVLTPAMTPELVEQGVSGNLEIEVFTPLRQSNDDDTADTSSSGAVASTTPDTIADGAAPVRVANRFADSTAYLSGDYYLVVAAQAYGEEGSTTEFPFTVEVGVSEDDATAPVYADGARLITGEDPADEGGDEQGPSVANRVLPGTTRTFAGILLGLLALGCVVGGARLLRSPSRGI